MIIVNISLFIINGVKTSVGRTAAAGFKDQPRGKAAEFKDQLRSWAAGFRGQPRNYVAEFKDQPRNYVAGGGLKSTSIPQPVVVDGYKTTTGSSDLWEWIRSCAAEFKKPTQKLCC